MSREIILSTTTSVNDSGLLAFLLPVFQRQTGYTVKTVSVGSGNALLLASRGEADVVLSHAPVLEEKYVAEGTLINRRPVMCNEFVIVGPPTDPARVRGLANAVEALRRIAQTASRFMSRGDNSGTHNLEIELWRLAHITSTGAWYLRSGSGMGDTLRVADDQSAYTLSDRATLLKFQEHIDLIELVRDLAHLRNTYSVLEVNATGRVAVNNAGAKAFSAFLLGQDTQNMIGRYGLEKFGEPLFIPLADCPRTR